MINSDFVSPRTLGCFWTLNDGMPKDRRRISGIKVEQSQRWPSF